MRNEKAKEDEIRIRLERLEKLIEQLAAAKGETRIHIEHLHVQHAVLEQMTVRMDQLDVKEVSGSLNIGNNFHTTKGNGASPKPDSQPPSRIPGKEVTQDGDSSGKARYAPRGEEVVLRPTPNGFSFRFDKGVERKEED